MIQAENVLGSHYDDIKSMVVRNDFDTETLESFSAAGIRPPVSSAKFIVDLYFFSCKIDRYKVVFFEDRIEKITFIKEKDDALAMINDLIASERFDFKSVTKKQIEETPFEVLKDDSEEGMGFIEFKIQHFKSEPSQFNINNIDQYAYLMFRSDDYAIIIKQEYIENDCFFVFELRRFKLENK